MGRHSFYIRLVAALSLLILFIQINAVAWLTFWFSINQKEISETVCEKVVVACNGNCYLTKQIEKETQPEPARPVTGKQDFKIKDKTDPVILSSHAQSRVSDSFLPLSGFGPTRVISRTLSPESPPPDSV